MLEANSGFNAKTIPNNQKLAIGGFLLFIMVMTRPHFFNHIQDASWPVFFLLGFYIRNVIGLPIFLLAAFIVDLITIESKGGQSYCFTITYPFLALAYSALWFAGRWFAANYRENVKGFAYFVAAAVIGTTVCYFISSGAFYWLSGRFEVTTLAEFSSRVGQFLPMFMKTTLLYLAIAAVVHLVVSHTIFGKKAQISHS